MRSRLPREYLATLQTVSDIRATMNQNLQWFSPGSEGNRLALRRVGRGHPEQAEACPLALLVGISAKSFSTLITATYA